MGVRCIVCHVRDEKDATPARAALIVIAMTKTHTLPVLVSHVCPRHRRKVSLDGLAATPAGSALLTIALIEAFSLAELEAHLTEPMRSDLAAALAGSVSGFRQFLN